MQNQFIQSLYFNFEIPPKSFIFFMHLTFKLKEIVVDLGLYFWTKKIELKNCTTEAKDKNYDIQDHTMQGPSVPILIFFLAFCLLVGKYRR